MGRRIAFMINNDTVLVLGAGASMDCGFPSGEQLIEKFISTFKNASPASIDDFLDKNTREEFKIVGKICVVIAISRLENPTADFMTEWRDTKPDHRYSRELHGTRGHLELIRGWYNYLWKKIYEGDIKNNLSKLTFITFNYDRSLERFLYTRLTNLLNLKDDDAIKLLTESVV